MIRSPMVFWDSLTDAERERELALTAEQKAELDRRWAEHLGDPDSGVPWDEVKRRLFNRNSSPNTAPEAR